MRDSRQPLFLLCRFASVRLFPGGSIAREVVFSLFCVLLLRAFVTRGDELINYSLEDGQRSVYAMEFIMNFDSDTLSAVRAPVPTTTTSLGSQKLIGINGDVTSSGSLTD